MPSSVICSALQRSLAVLYSKAMAIVLMVLAVSALLEVIFYVARPLWRMRTVLVSLLVLLTAFASGALFMQWPNIMSGLVLVLSLYRIFNGLRVTEGRMHEQFLRHTTRRTSLQLVGLQALVSLSWYWWHHFNLATHPLWLVLTVLELGAALILLGSTLRRLKKTMPELGKQHYSDAQLPGISVAIPARNETDDLHDCLASILASNYPKLEVIVLDDCSQIKRTPEIIRSFAHDGVRFVQGNEPSAIWLPKNQAYNRLVGEASGEYVLFCGVDIRLEPDAIRKMVTVMLDRRKTMISVLPQRAKSAGSQFALIQAMRYWWELAPPRRLFRRPPVLSSCWMVHKQALRQVGGFEAARRSIVPEAYLAKQFIRQDGYSFLRSDNILGITTIKRVREQRETAVRTRYPQLHRRPELVFLTALVELGCLFLPFVLAIGGWWWDIGPAAQLLAAVSALALLAAYECIAVTTDINTWWFGLLSFPAVVLLDLGLLHYSMWKYEFSEVIWKERNICIPAMHVIPHLPKLR